MVARFSIIVLMIFRMFSDARRTKWHQTIFYIKDGNTIPTKIGYIFIWMINAIVFSNLHNDNNININLNSSSTKSYNK
jgi:hypothetical protein